MQELKKRVAQLEANSLTFSTQQKGPLPGFLRAVRINDSNQAGAMWTNFSNAGPGLGPYSAVTDTNSVVRAEWGNLAANGASPAQYGFRANSASGAPLFDSLGVIGLPALLAEVIQTTAVQGTNTSLADVSGLVTPTFTLTRQATVVVFAMGRFAAQLAGSGNRVFLGIRCGSDQTTGIPMEVDSVATDLFVPYCMFFRDTLAAGSYTAAVQAQTTIGTGGNQWNVAYGAIDVWQFGG